MVGRNMISVDSLRKTNLAVVMIDSTKLTEVTFKAGEAVAVTEQDYDNEQQALQAATAKRGRKLLVWCGLVTARVARPADTSEHPDVVPLADARYLMKVFGADHFVAMSGSVALSPDAQTEVIEHLAASKPQMVLAGMCVDPEQDGIWVRVGRRNVEATLVHNGRINGWIALCEGLDSVVKMIHKGKPAAEARSDLADRVVSEFRMAIMQWQRTRTVPPRIWLHGPGGDPSGKVHQALLLHSGCRVSPPNMKAPSAFNLTQHIPMLPSAVYALDAPLLQQPQTVLKRVANVKKRQIIKIGASVGTVMMLMALVSAFMGASSKAELDEKTETLADLKKLIDPAIRAQASTLQKVESTFTVLAGDEYPDWPMLFRLAERFPKEDGQRSGLTSDREGTAVSATIKGGIEKQIAVMEEMDKWAKAVYGPSAIALTGTQVEEGTEGKVRVSAQLIAPEESEDG